MSLPLTPSPANAATGKVITTNGDRLAVQSGPSLHATTLAWLPRGSIVSFSCFEYGDRITGPYGTENIWDRLDSGGYVSDAWIYTGTNGPAVPKCSTSTALATPAPATQPKEYKVAWTGIGVYPRVGASMQSAKAGKALPDGAIVSISCETSGQTVTDIVGYTSNLWDRLTDGTYLPNVFINTGVNGRTPGVPACGGIEPPPPVRWYDRIRAANWAKVNYKHRPLIQNDGDCTWFVSQALWAGGLPSSAIWTRYSPNGVLGNEASAIAKALIYGGYSPTEPINPTKTATYADMLPRYLEDNGLAERRTITWSDNTASGAQLGDLIVYDWDGGADGTYDHIAIVTYVNSRGYPFVSQHSPARLNRYWSWDPGASTWIENSHKATPGKRPPRAYLFHIVY